MSNTHQALPVLPLVDEVLLPGMVIPVTLDAATQAAVDAARGGGDKRVIAVPRVDGTYGAVGTVAAIEKVGRLPSGQPAAVVRGVHRARIGSGVPGPGAALWVESTPIQDAEPTGRTRELAKEYKGLLAADLQRRGAWQIVDAVERIEDPAELADSSA
jgi:ATP-dependent Lon protease